MRTTIGVLIAMLSGVPALACSSVDEVLAHYDTVLQAYIAKAPTMKPEQFGVWTDALQQFGDRMGEQDFAGACQAVDTAAADLGFGTAAAPSSSSGDIEIQLAPTTGQSEPASEPAAPSASQTAQPQRKGCARGRCSTWRIPL